MTQNGASLEYGSISRITEDLLAMARPNQEALEKKGLIQLFLEQGIRSVVNLQMPGEHGSCGPPLLESGFTYDPAFVMQHGLFYYNYAWKDYSPSTLMSLLDMVKVMAFAVSEGKVAVHCHAGLGRTGVLIACYLVYSLRVRANDAIRYIRLKRPNAVQTRGQILIVQEFAQFILPQSYVFCNRHFTKNKKELDFTLLQYLNRQKFILHGYEARALKNLPKVVYVICERLIRLCSAGPPASVSDYALVGPNFTQFFLSASLDSEPADPPNGKIPSSQDDLSTPFNTGVGSLSDDDMDSYDLTSGCPSASHDGRIFVSDQDQDSLCLTPDMPSCSSAFTEDPPVDYVYTFQYCHDLITLPLTPPPLKGLDDSALDSLLGDGIQNQSLSENPVFQELSSHSDLRSVTKEPVEVLNVESVYEALIADEAGVEGLKKAVLRYRLDLNARTSAYLRLSNECNVLLLSALLWAWFETLKIPSLTKDHLAYIVISADKPQICLKRLEPGVRYTLEYLVRFVARLRPLSRQQHEDILRRILASMTHQGVPINGNLRPSGKYKKLREGTLRKMMEFLMKFYDLVCENPVSLKRPSSLGSVLSTSLSSTLIHW
ncbi:unnamed protein product [Darwinula stevensoni]|uniref:Uncharacterized protein n=1 Tax=Darwinula stevensoni TaxID=69355 RepID=A0A7R8X4V9_9CRUS|nr:unnamed protein product [Darwinula stevensoni]CAG0879468.1 unnamed protein product [Darwinula stevensoni]